MTKLHKYNCIIDHLYPNGEVREVGVAVVAHNPKEAQEIVDEILGNKVLRFVRIEPFRRKLRYTLEEFYEKEQKELYKVRHHLK